MDEEGAYRNKNKVRVIGFLDITIGTFLAIFYLIGGLICNTEVAEIQNGLVSNFMVYTLSLAIWILVFAIVGLHLKSAYSIFLVTYQDALGPEVSISRTSIWIKVSLPVFTLILLKVIYLATRQEDVNPLLWLISFTEAFFRVVALYFVKEFNDDVSLYVDSIKRGTCIKTKSVTENSSSHDKLERDSDRNDDIP